MRAAAILLMLLSGTAAAEPADEPARPIGALGFTGDLTLTGPRPRNRFAADLTVYVSQKLGLYAAARQITVEPAGDAGHVTAGIAYRAAAARPRLEMVLHADAGAAWTAGGDDWLPTAGAGITTYLWPLKTVPVAVTTGSHAYLVLDGVEDTHLAFSLGLGLALAR
jgi:hypothetical protein